MKNFNLNASLHLVLCRDTDGRIWRISGDQTQGLHAVPLSDSDQNDRALFCNVSSFGLTTIAFKIVHKALAARDTKRWWDDTQRKFGIQLVRDSVFYRTMQMRSTVPALQPRAVSSPTAGPFIRVVGSTCHYKSTSITLVGETREAEKFANQLIKEAKTKFNVRIVMSSYGGPINTGDNVHYPVELYFDTGVSIGPIRRHLQDTFK